jgi:hypothetical protein
MKKRVYLLFLLEDSTLTVCISLKKKYLFAAFTAPGVERVNKALFFSLSCFYGRSMLTVSVWGDAKTFSMPILAQKVWSGLEGINCAHMLTHFS